MMYRSKSNQAGTQIFKDDSDFVVNLDHEMHVSFMTQLAPYVASQDLTAWCNTARINIPRVFIGTDEEILAESQRIHERFYNAVFLIERIRDTAMNRATVEQRLVQRAIMEKELEDLYNEAAESLRFPPPSST